MTDRNGVKAVTEGWYFKWYRGPHLLCGEEGIDDYKHRPSWEDVLPEKWTFDINYRCRYQDEERGDDETEDILSRVGTHLVSAIVPITKKEDNSRGRRVKLILRPPKPPPNAASDEAGNDEADSDEAGSSKKGSGKIGKDKVGSSGSSSNGKKATSFTKGQELTHSEC